MSGPGQQSSDGWQDYTPPAAAQAQGWQDYKAPAPNAGLAPAAGGPSAQHVEYGPEGLESNPETRKYNAGAGLPGMGGNRPVRQRDLIPGAIAGGGAALALGGPAVSAAVVPAAKLLARHPIISMGALEAAKQLPGYAGKIAGKIPSWAPLLMGGKEAAPEELDATGENRPFAGGEDEYQAPKVQPPDYRPGFRAPRSYYGGQPPEAIPPRSGLQLGGEVQEPIEGEYVDSEPNSAPDEIPHAPASVIAPRSAEIPPAPYRKVGGIEPEDVRAPDPNRLARNQGVRVARPQNRGLALPSHGDAILKDMQPFADKIMREGHGDEIQSADEPIEAPANTNLEEDLTPALKASLARVRAAKASRIARPN